MNDAIREYSKVKSMSSTNEVISRSKLDPKENPKAQVLIWILEKLEKIEADVKSLKEQSSEEK